ncbi:transcriptional regulator, LysR family [Lachnospiraceae bacterium TWA4]|nr:transcriptional regulator, LysR family [Lachnospiraceae bacterium TWA4]
MNINQLECFVSLASTLNFMQTAEELGLTQPAVSKQIKSMEEELGASLFNRTSRSVALTPIGQQFLPEARDILKIFYHSKDWISSYYTAERNALKIGYSDPSQMPLISKILKLLVEDGSNEKLNPELICDQTDANLSRLSKHQLDIVIGIRDSKFDDSSIVFKKLADNGFMCVVAKSHEIAKPFIEDIETKNRTREISTEELWNYRQILNIPPYLLKSFYSRGYRILPVNDELDNIICSNTHEALGLACAGLGYTMIPEHHFVNHDELIVLNWKESPHAAFGIYYHSNLDKHSGVEKFIKVCKKLYAKKPM